MFGTMREIDLKPGGNELMVTEENKVYACLLFLLLVYEKDSKKTC